MTTGLNRFARLIAARAPRERRLILLAIVVLSVAAAISLIEWTWRETDRLARQVPEAHARLASMQDNAAEMLRLNRMPAPSPVSLATLARASSAASSSRGLALSIEASGNMLHVQGTGSFEPMIDWLASVQTDQRLRPQRVVMEVVDRGVRLEAVLAPALDH